ncbi:hypothetical protein AAVH_10981 [Aphelenchoides avenae]|nr:hypothetical protein AAVH_10981 [Aphelenchus avenae]
MKTKLEQYHAGQITREQYYATDHSDDDVDSDIAADVRAARVAEIPLMIDELAVSKASTRVYREENLFLRRGIHGQESEPSVDFDDPELHQKFYREELAKLQDRWQKLKRREITMAEFFDSSDEEIDEMILGAPIKSQPKPLPAAFLTLVASNATDIENRLNEYKQQRCFGTSHLVEAGEPTARQQKYWAERIRAREKLQRFAKGDITLDGYLDSSNDEELARLTTIGPTDQDTIRTGEARMVILDAKRAAKHETLQEVLREVASKLADGALPAKTEPHSDSSDNEIDNSYDLHEDHHRDYCTRARATRAIKGSQQQPPRPKKPEPSVTAHDQHTKPTKKKVYQLRDRKKLDKPRRLDDYVTLPDSDGENRKKRFHQGHVMEVPQPGPSTATQQSMLHVCSHGVITGPGTVDLTFYVRGYKPGSDDPVTIKIT